MKGATVIAILTACSISLSAQWPKHQEPGVPRDSQGRVLIDGATPRTPDGKPDLSGDWTRADRDPLPSELAGIVAARGQTDRGVAVEPPTPQFAPEPGSPPVATFFELGANIPGGLPFTPWAADLRKKRMATDSKDNPDANCLPM